MAEGGQNERTSIATIAKSQKKYGTTSNNMKKNEYIVKHAVSPGDTLQGISLKYGVSTEQIRRANKIWASDSLFLKEYLDIPLTRDCFDSFQFDSGSSSPLVASPSRTLSNVTSPTSTGESRESLMNSSRTSSVMKDSDGVEPSIEDILIRIDSSIAQTRSKVEKLGVGSDPGEDGDDLYCRKQYYQSYNNSSISRASSDPSVAPTPLVMTSTRKAYRCMVSDQV